MAEINQNEFANIDYFHQFTKGEGVKIAVLDSELQLDHREFDGREIKYKEFITSDEPNYHGTAVTSLITGNNLGVAPEADIMHLKMLSDVYGSGVSWDRAFSYAVRNGAEIVCMSIGTKDELSIGMRQSLQDASDKGIIVTAPSGNEGKSVLRNPADNKNVIAVGGVDAGKRITRMSNKSNRIEAYALSEDVLVANTEEDMPYIKKDGTSFANAIVAGQLALIVSYARKYGGYYGEYIHVRDFLAYHHRTNRAERKFLDMKKVKESLDSYLDM